MGARITADSSVRINAALKMKFDDLSTPASLAHHT
jgi:hypothetical protein